MPDPLEIVRAEPFQCALLDALAAVLAPSPSNAADRLLAVDPSLHIAARLDKLHRRLAQAAGRFESLVETERHRARKRVKRLRYLGELIAPLYKGKDIKRYVSRLKPAQDELGAYVDLVVSLKMARDAAIEGDAEAWFDVGWLTAQLSGASRLAGACSPAPRKRSRSGSREIEDAESVDQSGVVVKRIGPVEAAAEHGMARDLARLRPGVHQKARRLHHEFRCGIAGQVEGDRMRRRRRRHRHRAAEARLDVPMQVAADDALDLGVAFDQRRKLTAAALQADLVHVADEGGKRRVVHGDDRRRAAVFGQRCRQPGEAIVVELAMRRLRHRRVDGDEAQAAEIDGVLQERIRALAQIVGPANARRSSVRSS